MKHAALYPFVLGWVLLDAVAFAWFRAWALVAVYIVFAILFEIRRRWEERANAKVPIYSPKVKRTRS